LNTPPFLLGLAMLFWGWQTGHVVIGAALGVLLELPCVIKSRWSFTQADLDRLWNLCALLFFGTMIYAFFNEGSISLNDFFASAAQRPEAMREKGRAALIWFQWFPMLCFPIMLAVAFAEEPAVDVSTFSWFYRKRRRAPGYEPVRVTIAYPFLGLMLFSAAASNQRTPWFYIGLCVLVAWALWPQRSRRTPAILWAVLLAAAVAGGYFAHGGLNHLQRKLEEMNLSWFSRFARLNTDTGYARTAMGSIGRLKLSDRIVLRLRTDGQPPPELLREASYNRYTGASWRNDDKTFKPINAETNNTSWILGTNGMRRSVTVGQYLDRGNGILATPLATAQIHNLNAPVLERNPLGALRVKGGPGLVLYDVRYDTAPTFDAPNQRDDGRELDDDEPAVAEVARQLGLHSEMEAEEAMRIVGGFFREHFSYSSYVAQGHVATSNETVVARFFKERTGHCEYFATATALLLRKAGLPTRYAVGYSVQEGSGKKFVVRQRHAHAWTLVWHHNAWHEFDTTPSSWDAIERQNSSWLRPVKDLFSNVWFEFSKWRWGSTDIRKYLLWIPAVLVVIALIVFIWRKQWRQNKPRANADNTRHDWPGLDSEIYEVERALAAPGLERQPHESWHAWLDRIHEHTDDVAALGTLLQLHSKYRFDPQGLSAAEREMLRSRAKAYVKTIRR
jgi:protein-glutamine gamma-glutamyltransferase